ncbi:hypothetical protein [Pedobacter puniceum]|uniref:Uncharacterized protein n=1 Tax=Pedobacter puniceum TaxID=2666136 RepID=A0A7K0FPK4_9SPHI|nr:hypothetical protein [Pedobacter puniceum]MRX47908.1 hypothetical protein [Pedobacter puniceum]
MIKISVNNIIGRVLFFLIGSFPFSFYLILSILLDWDFNFSAGIFIYFLLSMGFMILLIKFCCFDWDFYVVKGKCFQFNKFGIKTTVPINSSFIIKPASLLAFYFNVFYIEFEDGKRFYFRYNLYQMPISSFRGVLEKIKSDIIDAQ